MNKGWRIISVEAADIYKSEQTNGGDGGANGQGQWYGALASGGLINIIVEACRNGGGKIGSPGDGGDVILGGDKGSDGVNGNVPAAVIIK